MRGPLRLVVLGDPIDHSRSPAIHRAAMAHLGVAGTYVARRAGPAELVAAVGEMRAGELDGINVTMPLKREAARLAADLTPEARASGSVNTMRVRVGVVEGHSTDVTASRTAIDDPRFDPGTPILVLGAGGAAAAIVIAGEGRRLYLAARSPRAATELARTSSSSVEVVRFGAGVAGALVVNATPLGMHGESIPEEIIRLAAGIIDLPYGPGPTPTVLQAREAGLPMMDGVEFLALQAAGSFEWWTGLSAPLEVMLEAARKA